MAIGYSASVVANALRGMNSTKFMACACTGRLSPIANTNLLPTGPGWNFSCFGTANIVNSRGVSEISIGQTFGGSQALRKLTNAVSFNVIVGPDPQTHSLQINSERIIYVASGYRDNTEFTKYSFQTGSALYWASHRLTLRSGNPV